MPKVLINAQKEQICRSQRRPGIVRLPLLLEFLQNVTKFNYDFGLNKKGKLRVGGSKVHKVAGGDDTTP